MAARVAARVAASVAVRGAASVTVHVVVRGAANVAAASDTAKSCCLFRCSCCC